MIDNAALEQEVRKTQEAEGKGLLLFSDRIETKCNNMVAECVAIDTEDIEMLKKRKQTNKN